MNYEKAIKLSEIELERTRNRLNRLDVSKNENKFNDFLSLELANILWIMIKKLGNSSLKTKRDVLDYVDGIFDKEGSL